MKKKVMLITALLSGVLIINAQNTNSGNNRTNRNTNTNTKQNQTNSSAVQGTTNADTSRNARSASGAGTNTTTTTSAGATNTTGANNGGTNDQLAGGQMTSVGRYEAMGIKQGTLHRKDMKFVAMAHSSNALEIKLSQLAAQRATNQAVKDFATMMVQHHTMAAQEMQKLLTSKGALIPDSVMLPTHTMRMEMMQNMQGADFDKAYMRIMVDTHEEDVDEYEDEATDARDADIRAFVSRMLPTIQAHYTRAKQLRKQL